MRELLEEIRRRNVARVGIVYIIAGWLTMQVVDVMFPALNLPGWMVSAVAALILIGFPFALIFAWAFEMTPEGLKREKDIDRSDSITQKTGRKLNRTTLIILTIAVAFLLVDKFMLRTEQHAQPPQAAEVVVTEGKPSIAVLPFVNMSAEQENEYFSDGLSEELLNLLAKIPQLHVAGRTSSFAFKGKDTDLRDIGNQLNVDHILEGSVRKSKTRLRITAQLIDTENGYHLWSETYDRELNDVFEVQDEISTAVVDALRVTLLPGEANIDHGTYNVEAYEHLLQARYLVQNMNAETLPKALGELRQAVEIDPQYAYAWALLADLHALYISGWVGSEGVDFFDRGFEQVREYAARAVEINDEIAASHIALGVVASAIDWDFDAAIAHFERALALEPSSTHAMNWLASVFLATGRVDDSVRICEQALAIDPISTAVKRNLADALAFGGKSERALEVYTGMLEANPEIARINGRMARVYLVAGDIEKATHHYRAEPVEWVREMGEILLTIKADGDWRPMAEAYEKKYGYLNAYQLAEIYAYGGDVENAFEWLEHTSTYRDPGALWSGVSQYLRPLHDDPRWGVYMRSVGL